MPTGSAKQTTIAFNKGPVDNTSNSNDGDQHNDDERQISAAQKRLRTEFEDTNNEDNNHLDVSTRILTTDGSAASLFGSESHATIRNTSDQDAEGPREYRASNRSPFLLNEDDTERIKIVRLERLRDKEDRYSSHIEFLKECREAKIIPKGLRLDIEPSIGNNDNAFCEKWYRRLEETSLTLMQDIIDYSEKIENDTATQIRTQSDELKSLLGPTEHKKLVETMDDIAVKRRRRLATTKRRKFHNLRYNRSEERERPEKQDRRQPKQDKRDGGRRKDQRNFTDYSSEEDIRKTRETGRGNRRGKDQRERYDYTTDEDRPQVRSRRFERNNNDYDTASILRTDDEADKNKNRLHGREQRKHEGPRRREVTIQDAPQIQIPGTSETKGNYRDILLGSRPNSRTNLRKRGSNHELSRRSSHTAVPQSDPRDAQIKKLQDQLAEATSKNDSRPPNPIPPPAESSKEAKTQEVMDFISQTMKTLEVFREQLKK